MVALLADGAAARRRRMLGGEYPGDLADRGADRLACLDEGRKPPAGWHPAHRHQVITYLASRVAYFHDAQVHIGGEPPVELGLALARGRARFRRAEVQEAEADRLLQLVRAITGEEHHGGMRFRHIRIGLMHRLSTFSTTWCPCSPPSRTHARPPILPTALPEKRWLVGP